jgi:CRP-like cAMP-binding protein
MATGEDAVGPASPTLARRLSQGKLALPHGGGVSHNLSRRGSADSSFSSFSRFSHGTACTSASRLSSRQAAFLARRSARRSSSDRGRRSDAAPALGKRPDLLGHGEPLSLDGMLEEDEEGESRRIVRVSNDATKQRKAHALVPTEKEERALKAAAHEEAERAKAQKAGRRVSVWGGKIRASLLAKAAEELEKQGGPKKPMKFDIGNISANFIRTKRVAQALRTSPELQVLDAAQLSMLARGASERKVPRYTALYREGASAHSFYVLLKGRVLHQTVTSKNTKVMVAGAASEAARGEPVSSPDGGNTEVAASEGGLCFGTEGLSLGLKRITTATTLEDCVLLHFSTTSIFLDRVGVNELAKRVFSNVVSSALRGMPLFEGVPPAVIDELSPLFKLELIGSRGYTLMQQGEESGKMFLLLDGAVAIQVDGVHLATLPSDDDVGHQAYVFGEAAVLGGSKLRRTATVVSLEPCKLLSLHPTRFRRFLELLPDFKGQLRRYNILRRRHARSMIAAQRPVGPAGGDGPLGPSGWCITPRKHALMVADPQMNRAAMRMQSHTRGLIARRKVAEQRAEQRRVAQTRSWEQWSQNRATSSIPLPQTPEPRAKRQPRRSGGKETQSPLDGRKTSFVRSSSHGLLGAQPGIGAGETAEQKVRPTYDLIDSL